MRFLFSFLAGGLFGAGLHLSGMTDTQKVIGFLDFFGDWNPTLIFVMGGAILPMAIAWRFSENRTPVAGGKFPRRPDPTITPALVLGAILFGIGWGLVGLCPGPSIASLSYAGPGGLVFLAAMLVGMLLAPIARKRLDTLGRLS